LTMVAQINMNNSFTKIGDGFSSTAAEIYPHAAYANDKIWLFPTKYVAQPNYNWGHRVHFTGAPEVDFDLTTFKWSTPKDVPEISTLENLEEAIFVIGTRIFMLLFSAQHGLKFDQLWEWDQDVKQWTQTYFAVFDEANIPGNADSPRASVHVVPTSDCAFIVTSSGGNMSVNHFTFTPDNKFRLAPFLTIPDNLRQGLSQPVNAAFCDNRLVIVSGQQGCGFRWDPMRFLVVDTENKTVDAVTLDDDTSPTFSFAGARLAVMLDDGRWAHITGSTQKGMTGSEFNPEIWTIDLKEKNLMTNGKWIKSNIAAPTFFRDDSSFVAVNPADATVYMGDPHQGLYKAQI